MARKILLILIVIVVGAGSAIFLLAPRDENGDTTVLSTEASEVNEVRLGAEKSVVTAAIWVADSKGFFIDEGLDVTIKDFDSGRASFNAMLNNEGIDISTVAPTPVMFSSFERQDFSFIATSTYADDDIKIIAHNAGRIKTAQDLKGKKVGTAAGTTGQFVLATWLTLNGMQPDDVEVVDIAPSDLPAALFNEEVEAIVIWEPHAGTALGMLGSDGIRLPSSEVYRTTFNFVAMKNFIHTNPETIRKFIRAITKATAFIINNEAESQEIVAARLEQDLADLKAIWTDFVFEMSLDQSLLITLEDEARWAIDNNLTEKKEMANFLDIIYLSALEEELPEAVTIFH